MSQTNITNTLVVSYLTISEVCILRLTCKKLKEWLYENYNESVQIRTLQEALNLMKLFNQVGYYFEFGYGDTLTNKDLSKLSNLVELDLSSNTLVTDEGLKCLKSTWVYVGPESLITDVGMSYLTNIEYLNLNNPNITHVNPSLKYLDLEDETKLTDKEVSELINLEYLYLHNNTTVSNNSISKLPKLTKLYSYNSQVKNIQCINIL